MREPVLLRISEAARLIGVAPSTLTHWCNLGSVEVSFTLGGQRRISTAEVERIKSRTSPTRAERARQQTQAAREARAARREQHLTPYTDADAASFYDGDEVNPILDAFKAFTVSGEE